jgi:uracil-DNA glycosylase
MTDQTDVNAFAHSAVMLAPPDRVAELEADIKANEVHDFETQADFLRAVIREFQVAAVAKYRPVPVQVSNEDGTPKKVGADNPWSAKGWHIGKQGKLILALGETKAGQIAASAGCRIGSTKPNPAWN